jgi:hypothetical protein
MSAPIAMVRKRDGFAMAYCKTLAQAHPGEFAELSWNGKEWVEGRLLADPPSPPPEPKRKISPLDGVDRPAPVRVEVEPDTAKARSKKKGGAA